MANIINTTRNTITGGTKKNDFIFNYADNATINAGAGNDTVVSYGDKVSLNSGAGADFIRNLGDYNVTLDGGAGNDTLLGSYYYSGCEVFVFRSDGGNDVVQYFDRDDTIRLDEGSISSYKLDGDDLVLTAKGAKSGTIRLLNYGDNPVRVYANGALGSINTYNYIDNWDNNTVISGTSERDSICNYGDYVTVNGGKGNDRIYNYSLDYGSINGGAGNDSIFGRYYYSTLRGGAGNDTVSIYSGYDNVIQFGASDGNDVIQGFYSDYDTLHIVDGSISGYSDNGTDLVVTVKGSKTGTITLKNNAVDVITVRNAKGKISTISAYNQIENYNGNTLVSGTSRNDYIYNSGYNVTVNGGKGDDIVYNNGNYVLINGGAGNDSIEGYGDYVTMNGGAGNDTLSAYSNYKTYIFGSGDGHDVITNFSEYDTIRLASSTVASHYQSGDDYIISITGAKSDGSITIKDVGINPIRVRNTKGKISILNYDISNSKSGTVVSGTSKADKIFNDSENVTINAGKGNDVIYDKGGYSSINSGEGNDYIFLDYNSTVKGGAGNDTIVDYDSSNDTIINYDGSSHVIQFGASDGYDLIEGYSYYDTIQITSGSITSHYADENGYIIEVGSSARISLEGVTEGNLIIIQDTKGKIGVLGYDIANVASSTTVSGTSKADKIFNKGSYAKINAGKGADYIYNTSDGDYSTIDGGAGNDTIYNLIGVITARSTAGRVTIIFTATITIRHCAAVGATTL